MNYCKYGETKFGIVLVGIRMRQQQNESGTKLVAKHHKNNKIDSTLIEKFQFENKHIIGYCEIDFNDEDRNLKEPFEILLDHLTDNKVIYDFDFNKSRISPEFTIQPNSYSHNGVQIGFNKSNPNKSDTAENDPNTINCCTIL